jgi:uroporphyrinogen-III synthase
MIKIFCTKKLPEALCQKAAQQNIFISSERFISIKTVISKELKDAISHLTEQFNKSILFTSKHAVEIFAQYYLPEIPSSWKIFCLSGATKRKVISCFNEKQIKGTAGNALALSQIILQQKDLKEAIFFCGNKRRNTLPDILHKNHIALKEFMVYETVLAPHKIREDYNGFLFFSPSAVESFFSVNKISPDVPCFAIGKTTANAIRKSVENKVVISKKPDKEIMLETVADFFKNKP